MSCAIRETLLGNIWFEKNQASDKFFATFFAEDHIIYACGETLDCAVDNFNKKVELWYQFDAETVRYYQRKVV